MSQSDAESDSGTTSHESTLAGLAFVNNFPFYEILEPRLAEINNSDERILEHSEVIQNVRHIDSDATCNQIAEGEGEFMYQDQQ